MNGFNQMGAGDFLLGAELIQVCVGANEVILNFYPDGTSVTVFDVAGFLLNNKFMFEPLVGIQRQIRQIGKKVTGFTIINDNTAMIVMSDGAEIVLKDDSPKFEAVTFQHDGKVAVV